MLAGMNTRNLMTKKNGIKSEDLCTVQPQQLEPFVVTLNDITNRKSFYCASARAGLYNFKNTNYNNPLPSKVESNLLRKLYWIAWSNLSQ
jgi:hypothetical protein